MAEQARQLTTLLHAITPRLPNQPYGHRAEGRGFLPHHAPQSNEDPPTDRGLKKSTSGQPTDTGAKAASSDAEWVDF